MEKFVTENSLVSVIIPVYNGEKYLASTIESVISQTYQHWELILVDDGSTDQTANIMDQYISKEKRIRKIVLDKSSGGPARPRNLGMSEAKGKFIAFLDADDVWGSEKLENQTYHILQTSADIVHCSASVINSLNEPIGSLNSYYKYRIISKLLGRTFALNLFNPVILSSSLFRSDLPLKFREDANLHAVEDWLFWIELAYAGARMEMLNKDLVCYRSHNDSISFSNGEMQYLKAFYLFGILVAEKKIGMSKFIFISCIQIIRIYKLRLGRIFQ